MLKVVAASPPTVKYSALPSGAIFRKKGIGFTYIKIDQNEYLYCGETVMSVNYMGATDPDVIHEGDLVVE